MRAGSPWPSSISFRACERRLRASGFCLVELKDSGVEVPTEIVETDARVLDQVLHVLELLLFEVNEPHHHVRDLHARVVDVILHLHLVAAELEQANEGVAQNRISQMPDVGSLVGIDAGVLNQDFALRGWAGKAGLKRAAAKARQRSARGRDESSDNPRRRC